MLERLKGRLKKSFANFKYSASERTPNSGPWSKKCSASFVAFAKLATASLSNGWLDLFLWSALLPVLAGLLAVRFDPLLQFVSRDAEKLAHRLVERFKFRVPRRSHLSSS